MTYTDALAHVLKRKHLTFMLMTSHFSCLSCYDILREELMMPCLLVGNVREHSSSLDVTVGMEFMMQNFLLHRLGPNTGIHKQVLSKV